MPQLWEQGQGQGQEHRQEQEQEQERVQERPWNSDLRRQHGLELKWEPQEPSPHRH